MSRKASAAAAAASGSLSPTHSPIYSKAQALKRGLGWLCKLKLLATPDMMALSARYQKNCLASAAAASEGLSLRHSAMPNGHP